MTELDPKIAGALERSRADFSPPAGAEARMFADFRSRIDLDPPDPGGGSGGGASIGPQIVHALKIVGAVAGLSAAGLAGVWLVGTVLRSEPEPARSVDESPVAVRESAPPRAPAQDPTPTGPPEPVAAEPSPELASAPPRKPDPRPSSPSSAATLAAELKLIRAARTAPPDQALELLDSHAQEFPAGSLSAEREALRVIALCELDRFDQARQAAKAFRRIEPGSLLRDRVRDRCGEQFELPTPTDLQPSGNGSDHDSND